MLVAISSQLPEMIHQIETGIFYLYHSAQSARHCVSLLWAAKLRLTRLPTFPMAVYMCLCTVFRWPTSVRCYPYRHTVSGIAAKPTLTTRTAESFRRETLERNFQVVLYWPVPRPSLVGLTIRGMHSSYSPSHPRGPPQQSKYPSKFISSFEGKLIP